MFWKKKCEGGEKVSEIHWEPLHCLAVESTDRFAFVITDVSPEHRSVCLTARANLRFCSPPRASSGIYRRLACSQFV